MNDKDLCTLAREIFEENKDFEKAYASARQHANELREYIYDGDFLNQRRTTPLHIAVQQISDPEQYELVTLFYDKNEPWVLLQLNDEGLSALDILCRNGNEWLIRFLLPDSYNFDIDGIPDEDIDSIDDDDEITLYDILNLRFKTYAKQKYEDEENDEHSLQYTLTHEPQSYPLAECLRTNNLNTFKLLVAANFPLDIPETKTGSETTEEFRDLMCLIKDLDSRMKRPMDDDTDLISHLLFYSEEIEGILLLNKHCGLFTSLSRKNTNEIYLAGLCETMAFCIPKLLSWDLTWVEYPEETPGKDFIFQFLAFIETQTKGNSTQLYQILLKALLIDHETPQIEAIIFIINAFVACRKLDWSGEWTEDKADEIHDAYISHITNNNDFDPEYFGKPQAPDSSSSDDCNEENITYPHQAELIVKKRRVLKDECSSLWNDDLLKFAVDKPKIMEIFLAAGATFSGEMIAADSFCCPTLCRLTKVLGDLKLKYFISLVETLNDAALEKLCHEISDPRLQKYVNELFDLEREFVRDGRRITLETLSKEDPDYLLNIRVTSRLKHNCLPKLFKFIQSNKGPRVFFYVNYDAGMEHIKHSGENLAPHYFLSIFLSQSPESFFASRIKKESPEMLTALTKLMLKSPSANVPQWKIEEMLEPENFNCSLPLLRAVASRTLEDRKLLDHTAQLLELILRKPASKAAHFIEQDANITEESDITLTSKFLDLLMERKRLARAKIIFWYTEQFFRHTMQPYEVKVSLNIVQNTLEKESIDKQRALNPRNPSTPPMPDLSKTPRRPGPN